MSVRHVIAETQQPAGDLHVHPRHTGIRVASDSSDNDDVTIRIHFEVAPQTGGQYAYYLTYCCIASKADRRERRAQGAERLRARHIPPDVLTDQAPGECHPNFSILRAAA